jgi:nicotinamidase-related amidase
MRIPPSSLRVLALAAPAVLLLCGADSKPAPDHTLKLSLRSRVETFKGSGQWDEVIVPHELVGDETAVVICDTWDNHWCPTAAARCAELAKKMPPVLDALRARGVLVIHAPSECMDFYKDAPQRKRIQEAKKIDPPPPLDLTDPPLPCDSSDGGCDADPPAKFFKAWTRENAVIPIADQDVISDNGPEIYSYLKAHGIKNLLVMGVHANMCILNRTFAIKQMTKWGIHCVLVRDLTDAMYNPKMKPFVSHEAGTEQIIEHIEKYWCPSVLSADVVKGAAR